MFSSLVLYTVIHRIGGLEKIYFGATTSAKVIHRIGGLEISKIKHLQAFVVIHRIGGLEKRRTASPNS